MEVIAQLGQEIGQLAPLGVLGEKLAKILAAFSNEPDASGQVGEPGLSDLVLDECGRNIDAVEDVADVMENASGHFGHAGLAGGRNELFMGQAQGGVLVLDLA